MYRIAIYLYPDGEVRTTLQSNEKNAPSNSALSFFSKVKGEIEKFKKSYQKCSGNGGKESNERKAPRTL